MCILAKLRRSDKLTIYDPQADAFFIFLLVLYLETVCFTQMYRLFAAASSSFELALRYCGVMLLACILFGGYLYPLGKLFEDVPWVAWIAVCVLSQVRTRAMTNKVSVPYSCHLWLRSDRRHGIRGPDLRLRRQRNSTKWTCIPRRLPADMCLPGRAAWPSIHQRGGLLHIVLRVQQQSFVEECWHHHRHDAGLCLVVIVLARSFRMEFWSRVRSQVQ